jgi:thiol-disulfide isomerase/thioredoxin
MFNSAVVISTTTSDFIKPKILVIAITIGVIIIFVVGQTGKEVYSSSNNAPDFNLKTLDGKQVSLESFKGKPVILWFMATWCPSCVGQADAIKHVSSEYGNKINVLVIDLWASQDISGGQNAQGFNAETESDLQSFIAKYGSPKWKGALDTDRVSIKYGVTEVDSTIVVDSNGNIVMTHLGPLGYQPIKDALAKTIL